MYRDGLAYVSLRYRPSRVWGDNVKLTLVVLPRVSAQDSALPKHWSNAVPLQVGDILMADIASEGDLCEEKR